MSWSLTVLPVPKDQFDEAVDEAIPNGQSSEPGNPEDVAAAKDAMKALATRVKRDNVSASAGGHTLQKDDGYSIPDQITVTVNGVN